MRKAILCAIAICSICAGCLSVLRVPYPKHSDYSAEGVCTNRVWTSVRAEYRERHMEWRGWQTVFPTIQIRYVATRDSYFSDYPTEEDWARMSGEQKYHYRWCKRLVWIPLTILWLTAPFDAAWDVVCMPWDVLES